MNTRNKNQSGYVQVKTEPEFIINDEDDGIAVIVCILVLLFL